MSKYKYEIRKGHECEDIADAVEEMLGFVPEEWYDHVREWVADAILLNSRNDLKLKVTMNYLNDLKIDGWTGDITKIFEPYLDIAITNILRKGAERIDPGSSGDPDVRKAQKIVRAFQENTGLAYNWLLNYFLEGATPSMLYYLVEIALRRLSVDEQKAVVELVTPYIPLAVSERLKGENYGQACDQDCMASR